MHSPFASWLSIIITANACGLRIHAVNVNYVMLMLMSSSQTKVKSHTANVANVCDSLWKWKTSIFAIRHFPSKTYTFSTSYNILQTTQIRTSKHLLKYCWFVSVKWDTDDNYNEPPVCRCFSLSASRDLRMKLSIETKIHAPLVCVTHVKWQIDAIPLDLDKWLFPIEMTFAHFRFHLSPAFGKHFRSEENVKGFE